MLRQASASEASGPRYDRERELEGTTIDGRYRVLGLIGTGGMGSVYEVEHLRLGRHFALKLLRADWVRERAMVERFEREARAAAALHSQHVVSIQDSGALEDGRPYFVMERLMGQDLAQLLNACGQLPVGRTANIGIDACLGLSAAHASGLVHRDLKPENLFVTTSDEGRDLCKLLDFGVAKLESHTQTRPGALVGTARYMAPEQVALDVEVGPRADLFALGVILYRCLSGVHPFEADSLERVLFKIMNEAAPDLAEICPHVPVALSVLVARAMSRDPGRRPQSALDFAEALAPFAGEGRGVLQARPWQLEPERDDAPNSDRETPADFLPAAALVVPSRRRSGRLALSLGVVALFAGMVLLWRLSAGGHSATRETPLSAEKTSIAPAAIVTTSATAEPIEASARAVPQRPADLPATESSTPPPPRNRPTPARAASAAPAPDRWFDPKNPYVR